MAVGSAAIVGRLRVPARSGRRSADRISGLRFFCGLLVVCAGFASSPGEANSASRAAPLRADTLLLKPVDRGRLSSGYGNRYNPILNRWQMHAGIDWAAPRGTPVRAAGNGVVTAAKRSGAYGRYLRIDHGGTVATVYAHLERYGAAMRPGHRVRQGDLIGRVGSTGRATGPHLHYEVLVADRQVDPLAVPPIVSARVPEPGPVPDADDEGELAIGGPTTIAAYGKAGEASAEGRALRSLPLDADAGKIRVEDLLRFYR